MAVSDVELEIQTITFSREIKIAAPIEIAFAAILEEVGPGGEMPGGKPLPLMLERRPGGRWYRDLGDDLMDWVRHHDKYDFDGFVAATSLFRTGAVNYQARA